MHVVTMLSPKYEAKLGTRGGKNYGTNEAGMKQLDDNIGVVLQKLQDLGKLDNTIVMFTTDNGAEAISYPDGGVTPFKGQKGEAWEGGFREPLVVRWPGHIQPGTIKDQIFASLDWVPTLVDIAGGPKGDGLKKQTEAGSYPGILKTTLDGYDQRDYLEVRHFLLLLGRNTFSGALEGLEMVLHHGAAGGRGLDTSPRPVLLGLGG
jgi:arylsulfatase A-like enzyme